MTGEGEGATGIEPGTATAQRCQTPRRVGCLELTFKVIPTTRGAPGPLRFYL